MSDFQRVSSWPQLDTEIQIGPTGRTLLPLSVSGQPGKRSELLEQA